jgi:hypothetical protein
MKNKKNILLLILLGLTFISIISINIQYYKANAIASKLNSEVDNIFYKNLLPIGYVLINQNNTMKTECFVSNNRDIDCYIKDVIVLNKQNNHKYSFDINIFNMEDVEDLNAIKDIDLKIEIKNFIATSQNDNKVFSSIISQVDIKIINKNDFQVKVNIMSFFLQKKKIGNINFLLTNNKDIKELYFNSNILKIKSIYQKTFDIGTISLNSVFNNIIMNGDSTDIEYRGSFQTILDMFIKNKEELNVSISKKDALIHIINTYYMEYIKLYTYIKVDTIELNNFIEWAINPKKYKNIQFNLLKKDEEIELKIKL